MINQASASDNAYALASKERKAAMAAEFYTQFKELVKGRGGLVLLRSMFDTLKQLLGEYEHDFIAQLLFPEHYPPARYPIHFPIPTCVFETVEYGFLRPNNAGNFSVVIYPKRLGCWPSWLDSQVPVVSTLQPSSHVSGICSPAVEVYNEDSWSMTNWGRWRGAFAPDDIGVLYQSIRMTAACFRMQYMARLDEVSGYLSSSLDYKHNAGVGNTVVEVDYGLYKRVTHPLEGVRCIWFPKDVLDEEFEDMPSWMASNLNLDNGWNVPGGNPITDYRYFIANTDPASFGQESTPDKMATKHNSGTSVHNIGMANGFTMDRISRMDTDCMLVYGTGLPHDTTGGNQFRIELIRHWEGIPLQKFRQYLYGERPFTSQPGYDAMKNIGNMFPFFGTLTNVEAAGMRDVVGGRLGELDAGSVRAALSTGGDVITKVANALG